MYIPVYHYPYQIYIPDKGASVVSLATTTAAIFVNADDHLSNWEENSSQYNYIQQVLGGQHTPIIIIIITKIIPTIMKRTYLC